MDRNMKQEEVFDKVINQLPPDSDTIYMEHNKKKINKYRVRRETSEKNIEQKTLHPRERLKRKAQDHVIDIAYFPGKRKAETRPKSPGKNPPEKK